MASKKEFTDMIQKAARLMDVLGGRSPSNRCLGSLVRA